MCFFSFILLSFCINLLRLISALCRCWEFNSELYINLYCERIDSTHRYVSSFVLHLVLVFVTLYFFLYIRAVLAVFSNYCSCVLRSTLSIVLMYCEFRDFFHMLGYSWIISFLEFPAFSHVPVIYHAISFYSITPLSCWMDNETRINHLSMVKVDLYSSSIRQLCRLYFYVPSF